MSARTSPKARRVALIGSPIAALALALAVANPASAATTGKIDVATPTIAPGGATTVTATFTSTDNLSFVSVVVTPTAGATGNVTIVPVSSTGAALPPCDPVGTTRIDCFWQESSGPDGTITVTATASATATGTFEVTTTRTTGVPGESTLPITVQKTTILVQAPTTPTTTPAVTTTAPVATTTPATTAPTTTTPGATAPASTVSPPTTSGTLPETGTGTTLALTALGLAVLPIAAMALLVARRSDAPS